MGKTIREKVAELRALAIDPLAQEVLAGEGSVFEEHAVPVEETILPGLVPELREAARHMLTLSGLSSPEIAPYVITGGIQRFQAFVAVNLALAARGKLDFNLPPWRCDSWQEFAATRGIDESDRRTTHKLLALGAAMADRILKVYEHSSHKLPGVHSAAEIVTMTGIHIYDLSHILLDHLIEMSRHHVALHEAQVYFEQSRVPETWPSYI